MKKKTTNKTSNTKKNIIAIDDNIILFNSKMRKIFVEGILQDIKGYFESKTNGNVSISYEDHNIKNSEFGFKLIVEKTNKCKKQMWSEVTSAVVNLINYMFPFSSINRNTGNIESMDVMICTEDNKLEIELVSCW